MSLIVDHLILCVQDLGLAARHLGKLGLESVEGGRHQGHGTMNRIVPLGESYLELVAVLDRDEAALSPFGSWVSGRAAVEPAVDAVCLRSSDLDEVCDRLGLIATPMSRLRPDGLELRWRVAGLEEALSRSLPFFIEWEVADVLLPGRSPVSHPAGSVTMGTVTMSGNPLTLGSWAKGAGGVSVDPGEPGAISAELITPTGVLMI